MSEADQTLRTLQDAERRIREAVLLLDEASHSIKSDRALADGFDPRALAVAKTNAETAGLWLARVLQ